ncbi:EamA family transporter [Candidatus Woesearchaeota archaeon]|nr:EamA family transporter [Candidatus Woesearchaeota archaeon]
MAQGMVRETVVLGVVAAFTVVAAFGALFFKKGSAQFALSLNPFKLAVSMLRNTNLMIGVFLYAAPTPIYLWALKNAPLSIVYPINSLAYVWVSLLSVKFLGEKMNKYKLIGVACIVLGVSLLAYSNV